MVKAHPKDDAPAYGWVSKLWRDGKSLYAKFTDVKDNMMQWLKDKSYRDCSIALNGLVLRHVGVLGAGIPAVAGLKDFKFSEYFSDDESDFDEVTLSEEDQSLFDKLVNFVTSFFPYPNEHAARVRDPGDFQKDSFARKKITTGVQLIIGKLQGQDSTTAQAYRFSIDHFSASEAKAWLKKNDVKYISFEPASKQVSQNKEDEMSEELKKEITELKAANEALEKEKTELTEDRDAEKKRADDAEKKFTDEEKAHKELKANVEKAETESADKEDAAFVDKLIDDMKLPPAEREITLLNMKGYRGQEEQEFTDPEDEKKKIKKAPLEHYKETLKARPEILNTELFDKGREAEASPLDTKVKEYMEKHEGVSFSEASTAVINANPELKKQGADVTAKA